MTILPYGDQAILVNFEQKIDPQINAKVHRLYELIKDENWPGITFATPAYCSLTIGYAPTITTFEVLKSKLQALPPLTAQANGYKAWKIPVCYEPPYALDIEALQQQLGQTAESIIQMHTRESYFVFMLGFLPGFPYLGPTRAELACSRKAQPRLKVPAGSVGLAGRQTGIYPVEAPGGWQIIGRSPLPFFRPDHELSILFQPGDRVKFEAIDSGIFEAIHSEVEVGQFKAQDFYAQH